MLGVRLDRLTGRVSAPTVGSTYREGSHDVIDFEHYCDYNCVPTSYEHWQLVAIGNR